MIDFSANEVSAFYAAALPRLRQTNRREWRGPCPMHGGEDDSFAVDACTGRWYCFSRCGRGGDLIAFQMERTGARFPSAKREVFAIVGRPDDSFSPQERRHLAAQADQRRRDTASAELWRRGKLNKIPADLERFKRLLWIVDEASLEYIGAQVRKLTELEATLRRAFGDQLLALFRDSATADAIGTRRLVLEAEGDTEHAEQCTALAVRLLEASARLSRREVA
jgi:hypothetical protein